MQNTSQLYKSIVRATNHWFEYKLDVDGVGSFGSDVLRSIKTNIEMFHEDPEIGKAVAGEIDVEMLTPSVELPQMAIMRPYIRALGKLRIPSDVSVVDDVIVFQAGATITNDILSVDEEIAEFLPDGYLSFVTDQYEDAESEWIPQGVFYIDTRSRSKNQSAFSVLSIHGFDAMLKAEQPFQSNVITEDSLDTALVDEIARIMGVTVDPRTYDIMDGDYTLPLPVGYSCREVLGFIASIYIGCFVMTEEGKLRLISLTELPPETNYLITEDADIITFGGDRILV